MNSLKLMIKTSGYTYKTLAKKLMVSPSAVGHWIAGICKPSDEAIKKLAEILNVRETTIRNALSQETCDKLEIQILK